MGFSSHRFTIENSEEITNTYYFFLPATKTIGTVLYVILPVLYIHSRNIEHVPSLVLGAAVKKVGVVSALKKCAFWTMSKYMSVSEIEKS